MAKVDLNAFFATVAESINGIIGISVVEIASGLSLGAKVTRSDFDIEAASAYNAEIVKAKNKAIKAIGIPDERLEDMLLTLTNQLHVIKITGDNKHLVYLAVDSKATSLAMVRSVLKTSIKAIDGKL